MKNYMHHHKHHTQHKQPVALVAIAAIAIVSIVGIVYGKKHMKFKGVPMLSDFQLASSAFMADATMPERYTCKGDDISPPLTISGTPEGTASLALVVHDPDAPGGDFLHWTVWNIHPDITNIAEGKIPTGASQGTNDFGNASYRGPCPPSGTHHYVFDLYALSSELDLPTGASRKEVMKAIKSHATGKTELVGTFSAEN